MRRSFATAAWFAAALSAATLQPSMVSGASADDAETVKQIFAKQLPNVPGNSMTAFVVDYAPGGKGASHHHSGSVFAYVLTGEIRSQISDGAPAKVYKAGEFFYEPPGSSHLVSENASATEPASLLAVFVAADDATLTAAGEAKK
jgi:quercetin dioxygenase-like cupin family protein